MRRAIVLLILSFALTSIGVAKTDEKANTPPANSAVCERLQKSGAKPDQLAQQGCCSWHQGVCGCSGGRIICCDNTASPSCRC